MENIRDEEIEIDLREVYFAMKKRLPENWIWDTDTGILFDQYGCDPYPGRCYRRSFRHSAG